MSRRHVVRIMVLGLLSIMLCTPTGIAQGGLWFTSGQRTNRIEALFMVDGDTVTVVYYFWFTEAIPDFAWIIPLSSQPLRYGKYVGEWPTGSGAYYAFEQPRFPVAFDLPAKYCETLFLPTNAPNEGSGSAAQGTYPTSEQLLTSEAIEPWLAVHHYGMSEATQNALAKYIQKGMLFLVLGMQSAGPYGGSLSYAVTYKADHLTLPLRLMATAAVPGTEIRVWILSHTRYIAQGALNVTVDFTRLRAPSRILEPFVQALKFAEDENNYERELSRTVTAPGALAFTTEYAGPSAALATSEAELTDLIARYPYATRLYSEILPPQVTVDPVFDPAPDAPNISNRVDLKQYVDPLVYWGCSNREALQGVSTTALPAGRASVRGMNLAYPEKWARSVFNFAFHWGYAEGIRSQKIVYVFARRPVDKSDLQAFLEKRPAPPMFIAFETSSDEGWDNEGSPVGGSDSLYGRFVRRFRPMTSASGIMFAMLTSDVDWERNRAMYTAMLDYALALPYYLHPELRYTLFLDGKQVGFPEGWLEHVEGADVVIAPDRGNAKVRIRPIASLPGMPVKDEVWDVVWQDKLVAAIAAEYGSPQADQLRIAFRAGAERIGEIEIPALDFEHAGRKGYLRIDSYLHAVVELSAPVSEFRQYEHILQVIRDSLRFSYPDIAFG